jgi:DNA-binding response OmpR family regulator
LTHDIRPLAGYRVLLVEDNFNIARALARALEMHGAEIVGPVGTVKDAMARIGNGEHIDGALLDINLQGESSYPVVEALQSKAVRVIFLTGYDETSIPSGYRGVPCLQKPVNIARLVRVLRDGPPSSEAELRLQ